jgi:hypothetical protein
MKGSSILRFIRVVLILGTLLWVMAFNLALAPAQSAIRQLEEAPRQRVYQSRQTLKDQQGNTWQAIAFKRLRANGTTHFYLRLVGFPGIVELDRSRPLKLTNSLGKTLTAADVSQAIFSDQAHPESNVGQYDLQPILTQIEPAIPLQLTLSTLEHTEIRLSVSPTVVEEWRSLAAQE